MLSILPWSDLSDGVFSHVVHGLIVYLENHATDKVNSKPSEFVRLILFANDIADIADMYVYLYIYEYIIIMYIYIIIYTYIYIWSGVGIGGWFLRVLPCERMCNVFHHAHSSDSFSLMRAVAVSARYRFRQDKFDLGPLNSFHAPPRAAFTPTCPEMVWT